jgi:hypothetical protein
MVNKIETNLIYRGDFYFLNDVIISTRMKWMKSKRV